MNTFITQYFDLRNNFISTVKDIDDSRAEEVTFDDWSLKQVVSHLIGWDQFLLQSITDFRHQKKPNWYKSIQSFNQQSVSSHSSKTWPEIITEYQQVGDNLLKLFQDPTGLDPKIWGKSTTPTSFIKSLTHHLKNHFEIIKKKL